MAFADLTTGLHAAVFGTFGEPVVVNGIPATGVFMAAHESVDVSTGTPVSTVQPVLEVKERDCPDVEEGDAVNVRGVAYVVADVRPDGHGILKLFLHRTNHDG
ncbi:hypothetical protein [uncultured Desulfovibrio sp.]|uniref:head-tail joining protein n=1 Tax=uncultured Desulfovibrio sp. TaxID=167968 RepID=UPI0026359F2C|nr:hypothetical protein [uncultured Desulfovibrio sp.]